MVRHFGLVSDRELLELHRYRGLMGGMSDADRERVLRSAAARKDNWSAQSEKERYVVALISNRKGSTDYTPNYCARNERYQLERAIERSLLDIPPQPSQDAMEPIVSADRVIIDLAGE